MDRLNLSIDQYLGNLIGLVITGVIGGILPTLVSLLDSFNWRFSRIYMIAGFTGLANQFTLMESTRYRTFTTILINSVDSLMDIKILLTLTIILHFIIPPYMRYLNVDATDVRVRGEFILGAIPMGFYISTVLLFDLWGAIWSFLWRVTMIGLPSIPFLYLVWSRLVNQQRKEVLSNYLLTSLKQGSRVAAYGVLWSLETSKTLLNKGITFLNRSEALVIRLLQKSSKDSYQYEQLNQQGETTQRRIRLLKLLRRTPFKPMECELIIIDLNDAPPYEAISYAWRNEEPFIEIIVDNAILKVTPTIIELLAYFHSFIRPRYFWIDSVCINQRNNFEKSQQITLMKDIYNHASRVLVWLGPLKEAKDAYFAQETMMAVIFQKKLLSTSFNNLRRQFFINQSQLPLIKLFNHPWFSRAWIVQEVAVGTTVHILYGNNCIGWDHLAAAIDILADHRICSYMCINIEEGTNNFSNAVVITRIRDAIQSNQPMSLSTILSICYWFQASQPEDKVYAIHGIINDILPDLMAPDYSKPVSKVYEETMCYLLSRPVIPDTPHMLQLAGTGWSQSHNLLNLPSWVVDWSLPRPNPWVGKQSESWMRQNTREMQNPPVVQVIDGLSILKVEAVQVDRIQTLGTKRWDFPTTSEIYASWLQEAISNAQLNRNVSQDHKDFLYTSFWKTLTGDDRMWTTLPVEASPVESSPAEALRHIEAFLELDIKCQNLSSIDEAQRSIILKELLEMSGIVFPLTYRIGLCSRGNIFCVTGNGRFAMVPPHTREDDSICFLKSLQSPFILREINKIGENGVVHYELVGSCYVDGIMDENREGFVWEEYILQ